MNRTAYVEIRQLVSLAGPTGPRIRGQMCDLGIIANAAMVVTGEKVEWVGPESSLPDGPFDEKISLGGRCVVPGLVDAHTHLVHGGDRFDEFELRSLGTSYEEIAASGGGIQNTVGKTRAASELELISGVQTRAHRALSLGTTTLEIKSGYGLDEETEVRMLRAAKTVKQRLKATFLGAHAVPRGTEKADYLKFLTEIMLPRIKSESLASSVDAFIEKSYLSVEDIRPYLTKAKELGFELRLHADQLTRCGGAQLACELGAKTADHLEQSGLGEIQAMKANGVIPVLLPASVYTLGKTKYPEARSMVEEGLPVVLATDYNPGSSPTLSLPMVANMGCTQMRLSPAEALTAITMNAANSLGMESEVGSLESGKAADFVELDANDYRELIVNFACPVVQQVWMSGRPQF